MSTPRPPGLDLSKLPEPIRAKLQAQLDRLPPDARQQLLDQATPLLNRALEHAKSQPLAAPMHSTGQYSRTVQPGDRLNFSFAMVAMAIAAAVVLYYLYGN